MSNRLTCPETFFFFCAWLASMAASYTASIWGRFAPSPSKAPALIRLSVTRLLQSVVSIRRQKSKISRNGPAFSRSRMIAATALSPTLLIAPSPNRIAAFPRSSVSTVNFQRLRFTFGGSTEMSLPRQYWIYPAILPVFPYTLFSIAAMNCTG